MPNGDNGWGGNGEYLPPPPQETPAGAAARHARALALASKIRGAPVPDWGGYGGGGAGWGGIGGAGIVTPSDEELLYAEYRRTGGRYSLGDWIAAGKPLRPEIGEAPSGLRAWWEKAQAPWWRPFGEWWGRQMAEQKALPTWGEEWARMPEEWQKGFIPQAGTPFGPPALGWAPGEWGIPGAPKVAPEITKPDLATVAQGYAKYGRIQLPERFEGISQEDQMAWLNERPYGSVYVDSAGNIITLDEAIALRTTSPNAEVSKVWFLGGVGEKSIYEIAVPASEILTLEYYPETLGGRAIQPLLAKGVEEKKIRELREKTGMAEPKKEVAAEKAGILASDLNFTEKVNAMMEFYNKYPPEVTGLGSDSPYYHSLNEVQATLAPGEYETKRWEGWAPPSPPPSPPPAPAKPVNIDELTRMVAPFGITVLADYPYLSPIQEAHLRRLPQSVLEEMARYLNERGLDWRDWLAISGGGFYGGAGAGRMPAWGVQKQWG